MVLFTDFYLYHVSIQFRKLGTPRVALKFSMKALWVILSLTQLDLRQISVLNSASL